MKDTENNEVKNVSRRHFLKGAAVSAAGIAVTGVVASCSSSDPEAGDETTSKEAVDGYIPSVDWLGEAPTISDNDIVETIAAEVVVAGGGHAGIQAALSASEAGSKVAVIENQREDSFTVLGEDIGHWNSKWLADQGYGPYDTGEVVAEFVKRGAGKVNPDIIKQYVEHSGEMFDHMVSLVEEAGDPDGIMDPAVLIVHVQKDVESYPIELCGYKTWAACAQFMGEISHETIEGVAANSNLPKFQQFAIDKSKELGAEWYYENKAEVLVLDDSGAVTGVIAHSAEKDGYVKYTASKGVIVTTGDFAANADMAWSLLNESAEWAERYGTEKDDFAGMMGRDGSGHKMLCWAGGVIETVPRGDMMIGGGPNGPWGQCPFLWLNANGERFCNEGAVVGIQGVVKRQPEGIMVTVTDRNYMESVVVAGLEHGGPNYGRPVYYEELMEDMGKVLDAGTEGYPVRGCTVAERMAATVYGADTLAELADLLGYEDEAKETFLESIEHYNQLCAEGSDTDYGKDAKALIPVSEGPFYGCIGEANHNSSPGMVTLCGVITDNSLNVLTKNYEPIPGLYAAGNTLGHRYGLAYSTPTAGNSIGMAMTHGRIAGKTAASLQ